MNVIQFCLTILALYVLMRGINYFFPGDGKDLLTPWDRGDLS